MDDARQQQQTIDTGTLDARTSKLARASVRIALPVRAEALWGATRPYYAGRVTVKTDALNGMRRRQ
jgi:hypothetical protein